MKQTSLFRQEPEQRTLAPGETLFEAGDSASSMFAVIDGEIEIVRDDEVVERLGPDQVFGELAILDRSEYHVRAASARASVDTVLAEVNQDRFLMMVKINPTLALMVMSHLADRIRRGW